MKRPGSRMPLLVAALLASGTALAFGFTAACDGDPQPAETGNSTGVTAVEHEGTIELDRSQLGLGEEVVITGSGWNGNGPIKIFLLTEEQYFAGGSARAIEREAVRLGEVTPDGDDSVIFRFRLTETYEMRDGTPLRIETGQKLFVFAQQDTERGFSGVGVGPLIVRP